jgi:thioredoxin-related protein
MKLVKTPFITCLLFIISSTLFCSAQLQEKKVEKIQWMSFQDAAKVMQTQPKKMFIDVYTKWCGWCKRMDATTFEDPAIVAYMTNNFYAVKFDAETHDTIVVKDKPYTFKPEYKSNEFAVQMLNGSMSYPTSVYIDETFNEIGPVPGYLTAEQLLPVLKYFAEDIYKTKKWEDYLNETVKH